jgi:hypothetical protein
LRSGAVPGSQTWGILDITPGNDPFAELAAKGLTGGPRDLVQRVKGWPSAHPDQERLLLVLDQFEQVIIDTPEPVRSEFLAELNRLLREGQDVGIILVMRSDYLGVLTGKELSEINLNLGSRSVFIDRTLTREELTAIVGAPASKVGLAIADSLVDAIGPALSRVFGELF